MIDIPERVKLILLKDNSKKNFRVHFPNGEHSDLINDHIESESVELVESMSSNVDVEFGSCDATSLTFDADLDINVRDMTIDAQIEIDISNEPAEFIEQFGQYSDDLDFPFYPIHYGTFVVNSCRKLASGLSRIEAYTKLLGATRVTYAYRASDTDAQFSDQCLNKMIMNGDSTGFTFDIKKFIYENIEGIEITETKIPLDIGTYSESGFGGGTLKVSMEMPDGSSQIIEASVSTDEMIYSKTVGDPMAKELFLFETSDDAIYEFIYDTLDAEFGGKAERKKTLKFYFEGYDNRLPDIDNRYWMVEQNNYSRIVYPQFGLSSSNLSKVFFQFRCTKTVTLNFYVDGRRKTYTFENPSSEYALYQIDTSGWEKSELSFPRTYREYYGWSFEYRTIFDEGLTVTKKDKKGNVTTVTYQLSMRNLIEAMSELEASFGLYVRRKRQFSFEKLDPPLLTFYPDENLYPANTLVPRGLKYNIPRAVIMDAEWDDQYNIPYDKVLCTCSPTDADKEMNLVYDFIPIHEHWDADNVLEYDISNNYYLRVSSLTQAQIEKYMRAIGRSLRYLKYMKGTIQMIGLPFLEVGDWIEFQTNAGTMNTIILRQTIKGVQHLTTTIESE